MKHLNIDSSKCDSSHSGEDGFSILETLVTLIIISLAGALMSGFLIQLRQFDRQSRDRAVFQSASAAIAYVSETLSSAQNTPYRFSENGSQEIFFGQTGRVRFTAPVRISSNTYALRQVEFSLDQNDNSLRIYTSPILQDDRDAETKSQIILINTRTLKFSYLSGDGNWLDQWPAGIEHPIAIKSTIELAVPHVRKFESIANIKNAIHRRR